MSGTMNLICACVLVVLGNVLEFRTYRAPNQEDGSTEKYHETLVECDINTILLNEHLAMCHARGVALHLMEWIRTCTVITGPTDEIVHDLPSYFLIQVIKTLSVYKINTDETPDLKRDGLFTYDMLVAQVANVVDFSPKFQTFFDTRHLMPESFKLEDLAKYKITWLPDAHKWDGGDKSEFFSNSLLYISQNTVRFSCGWSNKIRQPLFPQAT